jgi:flagellar basal body rod protein FlgB
MQLKNLIQFILVLFAALPLYAQSAPLHAKAGAWENTITSTATISSGMISPDMLKSMPPERREMLMHPKQITITDKTCVKESDSIENAFNKNNINMKCEQKNVKKTSTSYEADMSCTQNMARGGQSTIKMHVKFVAESPERMVSTTDMESSFGNSHIVTKSHWLGASCAGIPEHPVSTRQ